MMHFIDLNRSIQRLIQKANRKSKGSKTFKKISRLTQDHATTVQLHFHQGLKAFKKKINPKDLERAFESKNPSSLIKEIPWDHLPGHLEKAKNKLNETLLKSQDIASLDHQRNLDTKRLNHQAVTAQTDIRMNSFIQDVNQKGRDQIRRAVNQAVINHKTPRQVAQQIQGVIGLNDRQAGALNNYRKQLETKGLSESKIEAHVSRYEDRLLKQRAMTIAKTETRIASSYGHLNVWQEASRQGLVDGNFVRKVWVIAGSNVCEDCQEMEGTAVGLFEPFTLPDGSFVDVPNEIHSNCFSKGHKVLTHKGEIPIEEVRPGDYVITHKGRFRKVLRTLERDYEGDFYHISIDNKLLKCTPEHPFLIKQGWSFARDLSKGDQTFKLSASQVLFKQIKDCPTMKSKISQFFVIIHSMLIQAVKLTTMNFKSNHTLRNSNINIVLKNSFQRLYYKSSFIKNTNEFFFKTGIRFHQFFRHSSLTKFIFRDYSTFSGFISKLSNLSSLFQRHILIPDMISFRESSKDHSIFLHNSDDSVSCASIFFSKFNLSHSRIIKFLKLKWINIIPKTAFLNHEHDIPRVVIDHIEKTYFKGKVYNLSVEEDESYVCEEIITHNCQCSVDFEYGSHTQEMSGTDFEE